MADCVDLSAHARLGAREAFLSGAGWAEARRAPLAGDASRRSYTRLYGSGGATAMLMDAPASHGEDVRPFMRLTNHLRSMGFSAPEILAADDASCFLLLEDLGDALFAREAARDPALERPLYEAAVDLLVSLHQEAAPAPSLAEAYDREVHLREARLFTDWYAFGALGEPLAESEIAGFEAGVSEALGAVGAHQMVLTLRDFHAENLIWLPMRRGVARVGLLDYQDALIGHPAYDLLSLLEDARRDLSPGLADAMIERYLSGMRPSDPSGFRAAYAGLAAIRNLKIVGIFSRLWLRDGKPRYLELLPRIYAHLLRDLEHPACAALRRVVARLAPPPTPNTLDAIRSRPTQAPPPAPLAQVDTAMALAAGLGKRMRPLTDDTPKPLIKAGGETLLDRALDQAKAEGVQRIIVNAHYLGEQIAAHLEGRTDAAFTISMESEALETGGGVVQALPLIDREAFFVLNSDNVWLESDAIAPLRRLWRPEAMDALLLLAPKAAAIAHNGAGDFFVEVDGRLRRRGEAAAAPYVYCGAQILARRALDGAPSGAFSLNETWSRAIGEGRAYGAILAGGWVDVGTPEGLKSAEIALEARDSGASVSETA